MPPVTEGVKESSQKPEVDKLKLIKTAEGAKKEAGHYMLDDMEWEICRNHHVSDGDN